MEQKMGELGNMIKIKITGLKRVQRNLKRLPILIEAKGNQYFMANQSRFIDKAKETIKTVVYESYPNPAYVRTYKLLNSAKAQAISIGNVKMLIFCDPTMTPGQKSGEKGGYYDVYNTYSKDVLAGTGSVGAITGARNWLPVWMAYFGRVIPAEYNNSVKAAIGQTFKRGYAAN